MNFQQYPNMKSIIMGPNTKLVYSNLSGAFENMQNL
jgi:hypothetical protein